MFAWQDGEIRPFDAVDVRHAVGCFETLRIHRGAPFRLPAHIARLERGLEALRLAFPRAESQMATALRAVVDRNRLTESLVRFEVGGLAPGASEIHATAVLRPLPAIPPRVRLIVARSVRRQIGPLTGVKLTSRETEGRATAEARRRDAFDAILLNREDRVVETTARNVFAASDAGIVTPRLAEGALPGITRGVILEVAAGLGLSVSEGAFEVADLGAAQEVFLTGSGVGVLGVHEVEKHSYNPVPGPMTRRLQAAYRERLDAESRWTLASG